MTNRYNIAIAGVLLAICLGVSSCTKDLSFENFPVNPVNDISIGGLTGPDGPLTFNALLGDTLRITPAITFSLDPNETGNYSFRWYVLHSQDITHGAIGSPIREAPGGRTTLLSTERNLVLPVGGIFANPTLMINPFILVFQVVDEDTGITREQRFRVQVVSPLAHALWILHERENDFDISIVTHFNDSINLVNNVLDMFGSEIPRTGHTPKELHVFPTRSTSPSRSSVPEALTAVLIHSDKAAHGVHPFSGFGFEPAHHNLWAWTQFGVDIQGGNPSPTRIVPTFYRSGVGVNVIRHSRRYVMHNGNWYAAIDDAHARLLMWYPLNRVPNTTGGWDVFRPSRFIAANTNTCGAMLFDEDSGSFMYVVGGSPMSVNANLWPPQTVFRSHVLNQAPGDTHFYWQGNENLRYMAIARHSGGMAERSIGFAIVKCSRESRYRHVEFEMLRATTTPVMGTAQRPIQRSATTFLNTAWVENVRIWRRHPQARTVGVLFAATYNNRIFRVPLSAVNMPVDITEDLLQTGYRLVTMDFLRISDWWHFRDVLAVSSYNPALPIEESGRVELFDYDPATGIFTTRMFRQGGSLNQDDDEALVPMVWYGFGRPTNVQDARGFDLMLRAVHQ